MACPEPCYTCITKHCVDADTKYERILDVIKHQQESLNPNKFWINVDWEYEDETAMAAFKRVRTWLTENGFEFNEPTYKRWISHMSDGRPNYDTGCHYGTLYIRKKASII